MKGLTSGFGMEPGVPPSLWPPGQSPVGLITGPGRFGGCVWASSFGVWPLGFGVAFWRTGLSGACIAAFAFGVCLWRAGHCFGALPFWALLLCKLAFGFWRCVYALPLG